MKDDWEKRAYADLTNAVQNGKADCARALLKQGLDPYYRPEGMEPLFIAAVKQNNHDVVDVFLDFGVDPNKFRTSNGRTALESACLDRATAMAVKLLDKGANPNIPVGEDGYSLLHHVVSMNNAKLTVAMLEHGANEDALGPTGQTVISFAAADAKVAIHEYHAMKANRRLHGMHQRLRRNNRLAP